MADKWTLARLKRTAKINAGAWLHDTDVLDIVKEIKEKDSEISRFDKAVSGYMMYLDAKIRENTLIEPEEARDELRERLKRGR